MNTDQVKGHIIYPSDNDKEKISKISTQHNGNIFKNIGFSLIFFPVSLLAFIYAVTLLSLSIGLSITVIGLPIMYFFLGSLPLLVNIRSDIISSIYGTNEPKFEIKDKQGNFMERLWQVVKDPNSYKALLYIFMAFPLGIIYFTMTITFLSVSVSLLLSFLYIPFSNIVDSWGIVIAEPVFPFLLNFLPLWVIIIILMMLGIIVLVVGIKIINEIPRIDSKLLQIIINI